MCDVRGGIILNHNKWLWELMLFELKHTNGLNTARYTHTLQSSNWTKSFCSIGSQFTRVCSHFSLKTGNKNNAPQLWPCSWENYMWHQPSCVSQPINCEFHEPRAMTNCMNLWLSQTLQLLSLSLSLWAKSNITVFFSVKATFNTSFLINTGYEWNDTVSVTITGKRYTDHLFLYD